MIKELEEEREESQDPEIEFAISGAVRECGGLEIILSMIQVCCVNTFGFLVPQVQCHEVEKVYIYSTVMLQFCYFY